jgi:hypothetical protein
MATRLIFVCHGQLDHEREGGLRLVKLINDTPGFRAFFAETVHDTDGLSQHIFANLERCDGFLAVMHKRGEVTFLDRHSTRASVWIQQELAIVSFLNYQRHAGSRIKVRVFAQRGIKREGLAEVLILNPVGFERDEDLPRMVSDWLMGPDFADDPIERTREGLFDQIAAQVADLHWHYLEVLMILSLGTTSRVREWLVQRMFQQLGHTTADWRRARDELLALGLTEVESGPPDIGNVQSLTPGFLDLIADELRRRGASWPTPSSSGPTHA